MTAVKIQSIQVAPKDRMLCTAQQLADKIANKVSDILKTAHSPLLRYAPSKELRN